jgi:hypothetical protein
LQQTDKCLLQLGRDDGVGCFSILVWLPHAEGAVLTRRVISNDKHLPEPGLGAIKRIKVIYQSLDDRALAWPDLEDD